MSTEPTAGPEADLAERLKAATRALHHRVERAPFMSRLLQGKLPRARYVHFIHNLQALYGTMETALRRHAAEPALAQLLPLGLFRSEALAHDYAALRRAPDPPPRLVPAMLEYVARLDQLGREAPVLLCAHAYVRYLGDLNGGQALGRVVARAYRLEGGVGTRFYDFGPLRTRQRLIDEFRGGLLFVGQHVPEPGAIVAEAVEAFERHAALFDELDRQL